MSVESKPGVNTAKATEIAFREEMERANYKAGIGGLDEVDMLRRAINSGVIDRKAGFAKIQEILMATPLASHSHQGGGEAAAPHALPPMPIDVTSEGQRRAMLCVRLRCSPQAFPFPMFNSYIGGETVFMAVMSGGELVTLKDDLALFPSDALMAQLRLLTP